MRHMNGDLLLLLSVVAAALICAVTAVLLTIMVRRRRRPRTRMEIARDAVRAAARESARLGRSGQRGKGSGNHFGDDSVVAADSGA